MRDSDLADILRLWESGELDADEADAEIIESVDHTGGRFVEVRALLDETWPVFVTVNIDPGVVVGIFYWEPDGSKLLRQVSFYDDGEALYSNKTVSPIEPSTKPNALMRPYLDLTPETIAWAQEFARNNQLEQ